MEKDSLVVRTYPNVIIPTFFHNSRNSCREMPDTKKTNLIPLAAVFLQRTVSAAVTLPGCSACAV